MPGKHVKSKENRYKERPESTFLIALHAVFTYTAIREQFIYLKSIKCKRHCPYPQEVIK